MLNIAICDDEEAAVEIEKTILTEDALCRGMKVSVTGYTAVVEVSNTSDTEGLFLAQLYVQKPYTAYDKQNLVEKSAVDFLSSAKVRVPAHGSAEVTITVPTKYLASYDYKNAKTYILDEGDYEHLTVPVISPLEDSLLPGQYFWKIDSHPTTDGASLRTKNVIRDLQAMLS